MDAGAAVKTLDRVIHNLEQLRSGLIGESMTDAPPPELQGRYINAPVWPWFAAGWIVGALFILLFLAAWTYGGT
jgi:hypothetical protein